jgi:hypothetical protein
MQYREWIGRIALALMFFFPHGPELTGFKVSDIDTTPAKAKAAAARVLVEFYSADDRRAAFVQSPGDYIAEIHATVRK